MKIMLQRWLTRVCEDPILIHEEELRSFIESDFGYQPTPSTRKKASSGFSRRMRRREGDEERGKSDFAHPLHVLHSLGPSWNTWRPHGATLAVLGRVLDHLEAGKLVQPVRPGQDADYEQAMMDEEGVKRRGEQASALLREIMNRFPETMCLVREYEFIRAGAVGGRNP